MGNTFLDNGFDGYLIEKGQGMSNISSEPENSDDIRISWRWFLCGMPISFTILVLSVGVSIWFGIHWGVILGAGFLGVISGLFSAREESLFQPLSGLIIESIVLWSPYAYVGVIWFMFGWQSALSSAVIGWAFIGLGVFIMTRLIRKTSREVVLEQQRAYKKRAYKTERENMATERDRHNSDEEDF